MLIGWLLRFLVIVLVIRAIWGFLRGLAQGAAGPPPIGQRSREPQAVQLVKDPVCGTYVPRTRALEATAGGETRQFCSEACRSAWLQDKGRRTA